MWHNLLHHGTLNLWTYWTTNGISQQDAFTKKQKKNYSKCNGRTFFIWLFYLLTPKLSMESTVITNKLTNTPTIITPIWWLYGNKKLKEWKRCLRINNLDNMFASLRLILIFDFYYVWGFNVCILWPQKYKVYSNGAAVVVVQLLKK